MHPASFFFRESGFQNHSVLHVMGQQNLGGDKGVVVIILHDKGPHDFSNTIPGHVKMKMPGPRHIA